MLNIPIIFAKVFSICLLLLSSCTYRSSSSAASVSSVQEQSKLRYADTLYLPEIQGLYFQVGNNGTYKDIRTPILRLGQPEHLRLSFDVLSTTPLTYEAYIVACDAHWQPLSNQFDFVEGINRYTIDSFRASATLPPTYIHYHFSIPKVTQAGNYVLVVHQAYDTESFVLAARFMVYSESVQTSLKLQRSAASATYRRMHRVAISIAPRGLSGINPYTDFLLILRQNTNRATSKVIRSAPQPEGDGVFVYDPIDHTQAFCSPPNFRAFDIRHLNFRGTHIDKWHESSPQVYSAHLNTDYPRAHQSHHLRQDLNGGYVLGGTEAIDSQGRYVQVQFKLKVPEPLRTPIYIVGSFNQWIRGPSNQLSYDSLNRLYSATLWFKQGYYEYLYWTAGGFETLEGCYVSSENDYEAFVYYVDRFSRRMPLVGYAQQRGRPQ